MAKWRVVVDKPAIERHVMEVEAETQKGAWELADRGYGERVNVHFLRTGGRWKVWPAMRWSDAKGAADAPR